MWIWLGLGIWNLAVWALYALDKYAAKHHRWRVPERRLLWAAALFGAPGAYLGMKTCHHKTHKPPFPWAVPLLLILQVGLGLWAWQAGWL